MRLIGKATRQRHARPPPDLGANAVGHDAFDCAPSTTKHRECLGRNAHGGGEAPLQLTRTHTDSGGDFGDGALSIGDNNRGRRAAHHFIDLAYWSWTFGDPCIETFGDIVLAIERRNIVSQRLHGRAKYRCSSHVLIAQIGRRNTQPPMTRFRTKSNAPIPDADV